MKMTWLGPVEPRKVATEMTEESNARGRERKREGQDSQCYEMRVHHTAKEDHCKEFLFKSRSFIHRLARSPAVEKLGEIAF
jgi:hypothetical protein